MELDFFQRMKDIHLKECDGDVSAIKFVSWVTDKEIQLNRFDKCTTGIKSPELLDEARNFILSHNGEVIVEQIISAVQFLYGFAWILNICAKFDELTQLHFCKCVAFSASPLLANGERACPHVLAILLRSALEQRYYDDVEDNKELG